MTYQPPQGPDGSGGQQQSGYPAQPTHPGYPVDPYSGYGHDQHSGYGPPAPQPKRNAGLIVGSVAVVVTVLAVGGTLLATGVFSGNEKSAGSDPTTPAASPASETSAEPTLAATKYIYQADLCDVVDWTAANKLSKTDIDDMTKNYDASSYGKMECMAYNDDYGSLALHGYTLESEEEAVDMFEDLDESIWSNATIADAPGVWQLGRTITMDEDDGTFRSIHVQDSNAYLTLSMSIPGKDSPAEHAAALAGLAEDVLAAMAV